MSVNIITEWKTIKVFLITVVTNDKHRAPRVVTVSTAIVPVEVERTRVSTIVIVTATFEPRIVWVNEVGITTLSLCS